MSSVAPSARRATRSAGAALPRDARMQRRAPLPLPPQECAHKANGAASRKPTTPRKLRTPRAMSPINEAIATAVKSKATPTSISTTSPPTKVSLLTKTQFDLRKLCKDRGLSQAGSKAALCDRFLSAAKPPAPLLLEPVLSSAQTTSKEPEIGSPVIVSSSGSSTTTATTSTPVIKSTTSTTSTMTAGTANKATAASIRFKISPIPKRTLMLTSTTTNVSPSSKSPAHRNFKLKRKASPASKSPSEDGNKKEKEEIQDRPLSPSVTPLPSSSPIQSSPMLSSPTSSSSSRLPSVSSSALLSASLAPALGPAQAPTKASLSLSSLLIHINFAPAAAIVPTAPISNRSTSGNARAAGSVEVNYVPRTPIAPRRPQQSPAVPSNTKLPHVPLQTTVTAPHVQPGSLARTFKSPTMSAFRAPSLSNDAASSASLSSQAPPKKRRLGSTRRPPPLLITSSPELIPESLVQQEADSPNPHALAVVSFLPSKPSIPSMPSAPSMPPNTSTSTPAFVITMEMRAEIQGRRQNALRKRAERAQLNGAAPQLPIIRQHAVPNKQPTVSPAPPVVRSPRSSSLSSSSPGSAAVLPDRSRDAQRERNAQKVKVLDRLL